MKKFLLPVLMFVCADLCAQEKSGSDKKNLQTPVVLANADTLRVGDYIQFTEGLNSGSFRHIMLLNKDNEPVAPADASAAYKKLPIRFFRNINGSTHAYTRNYSIDLNAALDSGEITRVRLK